MEPVGREVDVDSEQVSLTQCHCRFTQPFALSPFASAATAEAPGPSLSALGPEERCFLAAVDSSESTAASYLGSLGRLGLSMGPLCRGRRPCGGSSSFIVPAVAPCSTPR
jgi:hypothetical protein